MNHHQKKRAKTGFDMLFNSEQQQPTPKPDRISALPDKTLAHILSFLPTKYAVATCIVSSSWRNLWASVPVLDFFDHDQNHNQAWSKYFDFSMIDWKSVPVLDFDHDHDQSQSEDSDIDMSGCPSDHDHDHKRAHLDFDMSYGSPLGLMNFVEKVLLLHDFPSILKFRFQCMENNLDLNRLNTWITNVVLHPIQEIVVDICTNGGCLSLPQSLCTSNTLVSLRLGSKLRIQLPNSVWFPSLKILELSVLHPDNDLTQKLSRGCPVLEDLFIEAELEEGREVVLNVVIPTLKRLTIDLMTVYDARYHDNKIIVDTPSLEYLSVHDDNLGCYSVEDMPSLVKAGIDVGQGLIKDRDHANRIYDILKGLSNVQCLSLFYSMEVLEHAGDGNLHVFHNVTHVDMHICIHIVWPWLLKLLRSTPKLKRLKLNMVFYEDDVEFSDEEFTSVALQEVPSCLLSHLTEIKIGRFEGWKDEMNLVKYLLKNGGVLQKVTIDSCHKTCVKGMTKILKELWSFPKGSKTCRIEYS